MKRTHALWKDLVPPAKHDAVAQALRATFGTTNIEGATLLAGGGSSTVVLKFVVNTRPYVMRVILHVHALNDPARQYACLKIAGEAGISPRVHYCDATDAVSITDFISSVPLREYHGTPLIELVNAIKAIQKTSLFPSFVNYMDGIDGFIENVRASGMLSEQATQEHFRYYARIQEMYPRHDPDLVSSHNDLNPRNILFDGVRLWVIDWETAFRNDRYADLANVANFFFTEEPAGGEPGEEEEILLQAYFGDALDEYKRARFFLMRQVNHMFYAMLLMLSAGARKPDGKWHGDMDTPRLRDFHQRFAAVGTEGDPVASAEGLMLYGKVRLNEALHNMKTPRFEEAIRRMA